MTSLDRLYGLQGAEELHRTPEGVYEAEIEPHYEPDSDQRVEIEEFDVHPPRHHLPDTELLLEWISEWAEEMGEVSEGFNIDDAIASAEVKSIADALLDSIGERITYRMANNHLRSLWVTWNDRSEPMLDGEPMYHDAIVKQETL